MRKKAADRRTALPRAADYARTFLKNWLRLSRAGRHDIHRLKQAMVMLMANDGPLSADWLDHPLKGDWAGYRECHIGGDFLLVYKLDDAADPGLVVFVRAGTHADLFNE
ncbi:MAG: type II toxin-antitoxin system YafQ family toxin [Thalassobaculales bacterium]